MFHGMQISWQSGTDPSVINKILHSWQRRTHRQRDRQSTFWQDNHKVNYILKLQYYAKEFWNISSNVDHINSLAQDLQ